MGQIKLGYHAHCFCWLILYAETAELPTSNSQCVSDWLHVQVCRGMSNDMKVGTRHSASVCVCVCMCLCVRCGSSFLIVRVQIEGGLHVLLERTLIT